MKKYLFILFVLLALISVKCSKSNFGDKLPPVTTFGANTFGCKVNGKVWMPYGGFGVDALTINDISKSYLKPSAQLLVSNRKNGERSDIDIMILNLKLIPYKYEIYNYLNTGLLYSDGSNSYEPFDTFGIVNITRLDTVAKIISGTFSFTGYTDKTHTKQVSITDGRFDLHYPLTIRLHK
jgi:hypothetical protein